MSQSKPSRTRAIVLTLTYLVSFASLVWTLRDANLRQLIDDLEHLHPVRVGLAIVGMILVYPVQGLRWSLILKPVAKLPLRLATRAVFVGLFASEVFPIRAGELIRCYLVSRWINLPFSVSFASALIERVFDGLLMWVLIQYVLHAVHVPQVVSLSADALGIIVLVGVVVLGAALFRPKLRHSEMPASGWRRSWFVLQEDLALIGHSRYLWAALVTTLPYLLLQSVTVYVLFREYNFDLPFTVAVALMMLLRAGAALPQAPATLGLFQLLTREFLEVGFAVPSAEAARYSLVLWAIIKLPLLVAGATAVAITGTKISELTRAAGEARRESNYNNRP